MVAKFIDFLILELWRNFDKKNIYLMGVKCNKRSQFVYGVQVVLFSFEDYRIK